MGSLYAGVRRGADKEGGLSAPLDRSAHDLVGRALLVVLVFALALQSEVVDMCAWCAALGRLIRERRGDAQVSSLAQRLRCFARWLDRQRQRYAGRSLA